jgi:hypothetical protein
MVPALRRLRQKDIEFEASLGYNSKTLPQTNKRKECPRETFLDSWSPSDPCCALTTFWESSQLVLWTHWGTSFDMLVSLQGRSCFCLSTHM